jgi:hypothetical protein
MRSVHSQERTDACFVIFSALQRNYTLRELDLSYCSLIAADIEAASGVLRENRSLQYLGTRRRGFRSIDNHLRSHRKRRHLCRLPKAVIAV